MNARRPEGRGGPRVEAPLGERVGIIGLGLIGGSLLRRLAGDGPVRSAAGAERDTKTRQAARGAGYEVYDSIGDLVAASTVVVLAVPLPQVAAVLPDVLAAIRPGTVVTDVVSVKGPVTEAVHRAGGSGSNFVGGHPMAGTASSGFAAADPMLFDDAQWALCLENDTALQSWLRVARVATSAGGLVVPCTAGEHDAAVARISHLPHLLAAAAAEAAAGDPLALALAAGSFRDVTRVAATRPALTAAMCVGNAGALGPVARRAAGRLEALANILDDADALEQALAPAARTRDGWPAPTVAAPDIDVSGPDARDRLLALGRSGGHVVTVGPSSLSVRAGRTAQPS